MRARILDEANRKWWTLAAVSFGLFMIMLDNTVVNVALPSIQRVARPQGLRSSSGSSTGYALTFAALMLTGGKLADLFGRRRIFILGLVDLHRSPRSPAGSRGAQRSLIACARRQGVGAALMNPATLSIISATFPPRQRGTGDRHLGRRLGDGARDRAARRRPDLTEHINWNWIFFINVPVGALGDRRRAARHRRVARHVARAAASTCPGSSRRPLGLFALTYGLIEANTYGWTSAPDPRRLRGAPPSGLALFVLLEHAPAAADARPLAVPNRAFAGANIVCCSSGSRCSASSSTCRSTCSRILGYSPVAGGGDLPADDDADHLRRAAGRKPLRPDRLAVADGGGLTLVAVSLVLFSRLGTDSALLGLVPGLVIGGIGMAAAMAPMTAAAMGSVPAGQGRRRLGRAEQLPPGRRIARHRGHGRDRRRRRDELRELGATPAGGVRRRVPGRAARRRASCFVGAVIAAPDARRTPRHRRQAAPPRRA